MSQTPEQQDPIGKTFLDPQPKFGIDEELVTAEWVLRGLFDWALRILLIVCLSLFLYDRYQLQQAIEKAGKPVEAPRKV